MDSELSIVLIETGLPGSQASRLLEAQIRHELGPGTNACESTFLSSWKGVSDALRKCSERGHDVLIVDSRIILNPGSVSSLRETLNADPMIAFVNPRSNGLGFCAIPGFDLKPAADPTEAFQRYEGFSSRYSWRFAPYANFACLLIRGSALLDFGIEEGPDALSRLFFRANRCGFRAALCNRAFAFLPAGASLGTLDEKGLSKTFPEVLAAVEDYKLDPEVLTERLLWRNRIAVKKPQLLVELLFLNDGHNGTFECAKGFLKGWHDDASFPFEVSLLAPPHAAQFHRLDQLFPGFRQITAQEASNRTFDFGIRLAQPVDIGETFLLGNLCARWFFLILDSIPWDCQFLRHPQLDILWRFVAEYADGFIFISEFTRKEFERRFLRNVEPALLTCLLSTAVEDYKHPSPAASSTVSASPYFLIVGNRYEHKFVGPTVDLLRRDFPDHPLIVLGGGYAAIKGVKCIPSGHLSEQEMGSFYTGAEAVIYPSQYEGFGFPVVESLAREKTVFARDLEVNHEIAEKWDGGGDLILFRDGADLSKRLHAHVAGRRGQGIEFARSGGKWDWSRTAGRVAPFFESVRAQDPHGKKCQKRVLALHSIGALSGISHSRSSSAIMNANDFRAQFGQALNRFPKLKRAIRGVEKFIRE